MASTGIFDRPSGARANVMEPSGAQLKSIKAPLTQPQEAFSDMKLAYERLGEVIEGFTAFNRTGHPEEWLPHAAISIDVFIIAVLRFQREVNTVVASDPYLAAIRKRQNLERIELHEDGAAWSVLYDGLALAEGASLESARVVRCMIHAFKEAGVNLDSGKRLIEDKAGTSVMKDDVAHA